MRLRPRDMCDLRDATRGVTRPPMRRTAISISSGNTRTAKLICTFTFVFPYFWPRQKRMTFHFDDKNNHRPTLGRGRNSAWRRLKCFQQTHNVHFFTRFSENSVGNAANPAIVRCLNGFSIMNAHGAAFTIALLSSNWKQKYTNNYLIYSHLQTAMMASCKKGGKWHLDCYITESNWKTGHGMPKRVNCFPLSAF